MINTFDPFQILGIDRSASLKAIKQAYRALSKQKHPDQNRDNPAAAQAEFIVITRAYKTLIDEESNRNWKLYGNPDGRQTMEFNLGLPTFLIEASNKLVVLATYLVWMVGVVPYCVYFTTPNRRNTGTRASSMTPTHGFITTCPSTPC